MNISILGSGRVGTTLAQALAAKGHDVTLGHRDPAIGKNQWQGPPLRHASLADAAAASPLVINATPGDTALQMLQALQAPLQGKVLLDVSNATERTANGMPSGLLYPNSSLAERLQAALPQTRVVKSLNTMLFTVMAAPQSLPTPPTVFISGDDTGAKDQVKALLAELGWLAGQMLDLGGIQSARATEALILMAPYLIAARGLKPFALTVA
ncbi:NADPH-dependent F420 reductase [Pseudorhodoferax sp.]|uniref:NADPH-dependent F420 reductase n=1 Tax=Pseudorhodoferax sp. TaxID=1993553 RepID=UPI0039E5D93A